MKIAYCNRPSFDNPLGGDAVQLFKTKENLENLYDAKIDIITDPELLTDEYDIVHIFNFLTYDITKRFYDRALELCIPIVASSIYWDYSYSSTGFWGHFFSYPTFITKYRIKIEKLINKLNATIFGRPVGISNVFRRHVQYFIKNSAYVIPNSKEEGHLLLKFAKMEDYFYKIKVAFNGVDKKDCVNVLEEKIFNEKYKLPSGYILQVGRIEYLKNQLNLLSALMNDKDIPIVFIGVPHHKKYYNTLKTMAERRGNVFFIDKVPHDEIASFYRYASVHVSLSLRESPGLVSMEALQNGCPVVLPTNQYLPLDTYFAGNPYVVDPFSKEEIHDIVLKAYRERTLLAFDVDKFSWENVARQTFNIYRLIIEKK